ncbi:MAG: peptidoglycan DD-metalloendopeptidase family protein [Buchnera aphidicola (Nurudea ibofushi)]
MLIALSNYLIDNYSKNTLFHYKNYKKKLKNACLSKNLKNNVYCVKIYHPIYNYSVNFYNTHKYLFFSKKNCIFHLFEGNTHVLRKFFKNILSVNNILKKDANYNSNKIITSYSKKHDKYLNIEGKLDKSFLQNSKNYGLSVNEIKKIMHIIENQINYYKLKINNSFRILIKRNMIDKKKCQSQIVGFKIYYKNLNYYGILFNNGKFYDTQGHSLMETFLKFPSLKQYRVSSSFNLNRFNPITKKFSPHQGVDLAMPIGTPILSISNGKVIKAKFSSVSGRFIEIRHNLKCITRYMHLQKILVHVGNNVNKGEIIGLSGSTGRSTGPHLHYEIWIENKVINPEKITIMEQLSGKTLKSYLKLSKKIVEYLNKL